MAAVIKKAVVIYLVGIQVVSFSLFGYDKFQASNKGWRVPEATLCMTALAGGWPGGMVAMEAFRHKTKKQSFREKYFTSVGLNIAGSSVLFLSPSLRLKAMEVLKRALTNRHKMYR